MGMNTAIFMHNDTCHKAEECPKTLAYLMANPHTLLGDNRHDLILLEQLAKRFNEPIIDTNFIKFFPSFHSTDAVFFLAVGNTMVEVQSVKVVEIDGKKCAVVELPEFMQSAKKESEG